MSVRSSRWNTAVLITMVLVPGFVTCSYVSVLFATIPDAPAHSLEHLCCLQLASWDEKASVMDCEHLFKVNPANATPAECSPPARHRSDALDSFPYLLDTKSRAERNAASSRDKVVPVSNLVEKALADQRVLLARKQMELARWSASDQAHFALWFGTTSAAARTRIARQIAALHKLNAHYAVENFRRASPPRPGVFAYVAVTDPTRIFLDLEFVEAPAIGTNSRAGTLTHEMSHFQIGGNTKDHVYGTEKCRNLARTSPRLALENADNLEFYVENAY